MIDHFKCDGGFATVSADKNPPVRCCTESCRQHIAIRLQVSTEITEQLEFSQEEQIRQNVVVLLLRKINHPRMEHD
jgi:hypothetical protein